MKTITIVQNNSRESGQALYVDGILRDYEPEVTADMIDSAMMGEPFVMLKEWAELLPDQEWPSTLEQLISEREAAANAAGVVVPCFKTTNFGEVVG